MSKTKTCDQCGGEFQRIRSHWSMSSSCSAPKGKSKKVYHCGECNEPFEDWPSRREARGREGPFFCSRDCKTEYQKDDLIETECSACGNELELPEHRFEDMGDYSIENHFCNKECESEWKTDNWVGEDHPSWDGGKIRVTCEECGEKFGAKPSEVALPGVAKFCGKSCADAAQSVEMEVVDCPVCEESFERKPYSIKGDNAFCGRECHREWMSDFQRGDGNPAWAGGKAEYYGPDWHDQRRKTLERDNFECQSCGMEETEHRETYSHQLNVHHIIRFKSFDESEEANQLGNLITLCHSCHKTAEKMPKEDQRAMFMSTPDSYTHPSTLSSRAI